MGKKVKTITVIVVLLMIGVGGILYKKPDWGYLVKDRIFNIGNTVSIEKLQIEKDSIILEEYTLKQLLELENCQMNQSLMMINQDFLLQEEFQADIVSYKDTEVIMNTCITEAYETLALDIDKIFQKKLYIRSAYRSAEEQEVAIGEQGEKATIVNASEHQAGLALDVYIKNFAGSSFLKTDVGQFVNSYCWKYGFIIRYPYYGERETGIGFEPWHIRYVGFPHAEIIHKNRTTLEAYFNQLEKNQFYKYGDYIITKQEGNVFCVPEGASEIIISPDNMGNYILTIKCYK